MVGARWRTNIHFWSNTSFENIEEGHGGGQQGQLSLDLEMRMVFKDS